MLKITLTSVIVGISFGCVKLLLKDLDIFQKPFMFKNERRKRPLFL
jgi:hypothetical protein